MGNVSPGPRFLDLPERSTKPRTAGITHVLDKGASVPEVESLATRAGAGIDVWKLGWGTAYLEPDVPQKVAALTERGIRACVGGTLLEVAWGQGRADGCLAWAQEAGFPCVEVSNGAIGMPLWDKRDLIRSAAGRFVVLSEVGSKDPDAEVSAGAWADEMVGDLEAGASLVLAEGRESGTVGLFEPDGSVREALVAEIIERVGLSYVVFEAPRKDQQVWFINRYGSEVNLGNIPLSEAIGLEALRRGLRADTIHLSQRRSEAEAQA